MRGLKRFGVHLAAALGATGVLVAASSVGAAQTRQAGLSQTATATALAAPPDSSGPGRPRPGALQPRPTPPITAPRPQPAARQRTVAGLVAEVRDGELLVRTASGQASLVRLGPRAAVRLNGRAVGLNEILPGDRVLAVGRPPGAGEPATLLAAAVAARRPQPR